MKKFGLTLVLAMLLILTLNVQPIGSWTYQDGTPEDTKYEKFGPRADKLLISLFPSKTAEWDALARGEIDMTDWPLTREYYNLFTSPPLNETINVVGYGPELSFYMLDINNADSPTSPVYPNPCTVLSFRQAMAHLIDRVWLDTIIGPGSYAPIWVPMSPALGKYYLNIANPYPYDPLMAQFLLDADGFPIGPDGWRYWI